MSTKVEIFGGRFSPALKSIIICLVQMRYLNILEKKEEFTFY